MGGNSRYYIGKQRSGLPLIMKYLASLLFLAVGITPLQAHPGVGILQDKKGNVYYTDLKQVWKITPAGQKSVAVPNVHTHELYIDDQDNVYGEHLWYNGEQKDTWGYYVWRLSPSGRVEKVIPDTEGFMENYSFVRDHFGNMYWADRSKPCQTVVKKKADNTVSPITRQCFENIRKIEILPDGSVFLIDFQDLKKIDSRGNVTTVAPKIANKRWTTSTPDNQNSVMGIWSDPAGNLYAAVSSERLVKKFGSDGKEQVVYKTSFPWNPSGGMIDSSGNLWILEYNAINSVRVERISKDNQSTVY